MYKTALLISLFLISVATLLLAIFGENRGVYTIGTIVAHISLVCFGYFYARTRIDAMFKAIRKEVLEK